MTNSNRDGKVHAELEGDEDGNNDIMILLDVLMAALRLVSNQHIAKRNLHHEQVTASGDDGVTSSSPSHGRSTSASTSMITTSTLRSGPEVVVADSEPISDVAGSQYVEGEGRPNHNDSRDDGGSCAHQPSTRWYCISRGRAVGVFSGWPNTSPLVTGIPGAIFQRYPTFTAALMAFMEAAANGHVAIISV
ncbi:uncharacterized protein LAESUDRAFT_718634 [Laetiporus sulphureus 93-53]|uniref:Ribonuclease H1 N-terminal domain-containing protein n=1 Tax=Laetiporus sulphureus 93-53 TaxID=1314785 RepID=A0A165ARA5_9APHY|nr:uncharacterized protein LAESUDRAFT_718634 [Laetiporus sulphureus 93-53]KZS99508.1 hypothetical protein LAESUDRAFT_718634 [Laetiporus sulphureus 93-53]